MKYILGLLLLVSLGATADELATKSDVGKIALTKSLCDTNVPPSFIYRAYATEGEKIHEGCWYREESAVYIFFPELNATAVYNPDLFKPD